MTPNQIKFLKGLAHHLDPVVMIGNQGLSDPVLREIETALSSHELIKIKDSTEDKVKRVADLDRICTATGALPVQMIGNMLVVYRANAKSKIELPK